MCVHELPEHFLFIRVWTGVRAEHSAQAVQRASLAHQAGKQRPHAAGKQRLYDTWSVPLREDTPIEQA